MRRVSESDARGTTQANDIHGLEGHPLPAHCQPSGSFDTGPQALMAGIACIETASMEREEAS